MNIDENIKNKILNIYYDPQKELKNDKQIYL